MLVSLHAFNKKYVGVCLYSIDGKAIVAFIELDYFADGREMSSSTQRQILYQLLKL